MATWKTLSHWKRLNCSEWLQNLADTCQVERKKKWKLPQYLKHCLKHFSYKTIVSQFFSISIKKNVFHIDGSNNKLWLMTNNPWKKRQKKRVFFPSYRFKMMKNWWHFLVCLCFMINKKKKWDGTPSILFFFFCFSQKYHWQWNVPRQIFEIHFWWMNYRLLEHVQLRASPSINWHSDFHIIFFSFLFYSVNM